MTTAQAASLPCTAVAVHDWLTRNDAAAARRFDVEFRARLAAAATTYDLSPVDDLVRHWWTLAWGRTQHVAPDELAQFERLDLHGDTTGLHHHQPDR